jgi:hypothetical protein
MKSLTLAFLAVALPGCFATVGPDGQAVGGQAEFSLNLPVLLPPLIVVEPGVSVVRDLDQEVFYSDGYYWARQDRSWYRSRDHRSGWGRVEPRYVPPVIERSPPGRYRQYRGADARGGPQDRGRDEKDGKKERGEHGGRD